MLVTLQPTPSWELQNVHLRLLGSLQSGVSRGERAHLWRGILTGPSSWVWGLWVGFVFVFLSRKHPWGGWQWFLPGRSVVPALKQDLFRMLTFNSYRFTFSEPFPVLSSKPESFQLFPQCCRVGISSGPWVERSSGPWIVAWAAVFAAQSCAKPALRALCGQIHSKGLGDRRENTSDGRLCSPPGWLFTRKKFFSICLPGRGRGKMWEEPPGARISAAAYVAGFLDHMFTFLSLQAMPETWRKPTLSGFPPSNGVAQNGSGKREGFSSRNFGRWHFEWWR